jgi:putative PIN family toxin of toxin-antitoxin system
MSVVIETSVWVSAIQYRGLPLKALTYAVTQDTLVTCTELEDEIVRILVEKFKHNEAHVRDRLETMLEYAIRVSLLGKPSGVCRDPNDDFVLECATLGKADLIVTGDKDLLSLGEYGTVRILTPRQYLDELHS